MVTNHSAQYFYAYLHMYVNMHVQIVVFNKKNHYVQTHQNIFIIICLKLPISVTVQWMLAGTFLSEGPG